MINNSNNQVSIVTAFYDIGRGSWTPDKDLPQYLQRSNQVYFERFRHLTRLKNDITVITSPDLAEEIRDLVSDSPNVTVVVFDIQKNMASIKESISNILSTANYANKIKYTESRNPEYWSSDYVLVTMLKAYFVQHAIELGLPKNDMVAWIDFGYCRSNDNTDGVDSWTTDFNSAKIHMFDYKDYTGDPIEEIVKNNDVYILGAKVVAHKVLWEILYKMMLKAQLDLMNEGLVDDDQGLWLSCYIKRPELFELHRIPDHQLGHDPFVLFKQFNTSYV